MKPEKRPSPAWKHTWAAFQKEGNLLGLVMFWVLTGLGECDFEVGVRSAKSPTSPSLKIARMLPTCGFIAQVHTRFCAESWQRLSCLWRWWSCKLYIAEGPAPGTKSLAAEIRRMAELGRNRTKC